MTPSKAQAQLAALFARAGADPVEVPVLLEADLFLDLLGEEFRHRLYLTADPGGCELCLRPEFTIPVARHHIGRAVPQGLYAYQGPVFRYRADGSSGEFVQAGLESFGRPDTEQADAEMAALAMEAARALGLGRPRLLLGDPGLFQAFLASLDLAPAWTRRLRRHFGHAESLRADLAALALPRASREWGALLARLEAEDPDAPRAMVQDLLAMASTGTLVGGRPAAAIAARFLEQAALANVGEADRARLLERYLAIEGEPRRALDALAALTREGGLELDDALSGAALRLDQMRAAGLEPADAHFSASFGRTVDYYTGFVFEIHDPEGAAAGTGPAVGGGRYDRLLTLLGAADPVRAVGFSLWLDRLPLGRAQASGEAS